MSVESMVTLAPSTPAPEASTTWPQTTGQSSPALGSGAGGVGVRSESPESSTSVVMCTGTIIAVGSVAFQPSSSGISCTFALCRARLAAARLASRAAFSTSIAGAAATGGGGGTTVSGAAATTGAGAGAGTTGAGIVTACSCTTSTRGKRGQPFGMWITSGMNCAPTKPTTKVITSTL